MSKGLFRFRNSCWLCKLIRYREGYYTGSTSASISVYSSNPIIAVLLGILWLPITHRYKSIMTRTRGTSVVIVPRFKPNFHSHPPSCKRLRTVCVSGLMSPLSGAKYRRLCWPYTTGNDKASAWHEYMSNFVLLKDNSPSRSTHSTSLC